MSAYGFRTLQVFTTCDEEGMKVVLGKCEELGLQTTGIHTCSPNGGFYLVVLPRDSKLGWPEVEEHKKKLYEVISKCHRHNSEKGDIFLHFTLMFNYEHEQLNNWQSIIELSV